MEGPLLTNFNGCRDGVVKEELIQYRIKNGMLTKVITTRNYLGSEENYIDYTSYVPICAVNDGKGII